MGTQSIQPMSLMTAYSNQSSKNQPQSANEPQPLKQAASGGWKNLNAALWKKIAAAGAILVVLGTIAALNKSPIPSISSNGPLQDDLQNSLANRVCPLNATWEPEVCPIPLDPLTVTPTNDDPITQLQEDIKGLKRTISEQKNDIDMLYSQNIALEKGVNKLANVTAISIHEAINITANATANLFSSLLPQTAAYTLEASANLTSSLIGEAFTNPAIVGAFSNEIIKTIQKTELPITLGLSALTSIVTSIVTALFVTSCCHPRRVPD